MTALIDGKANIEALCGKNGNLSVTADKSPPPPILLTLLIRLQRPLHIACENGRLQSLKLLLAANAQIDAGSPMGCTNRLLPRLHSPP